MGKEYDFSKGKRGSAVESTGKTRITILRDNDIIESFRARAEATGVGYQTAINEAVRAALDDESDPVTSSKPRDIFRLEWHHADWASNRKSSSGCGVTFGPAKPGWLCACAALDGPWP
ncbi:BrnA antitoxin family protein [Wenzhouxiangella marina]|uniref:BrnA antitoxin family protein n=1 Tax=Wenzhouxiangella marina TaxID=1579979 RepID=UPI0009E22AF1|nr:BrnA antitoxin family protein [Wenzhouxiangella marina]